MKPVDEGGAKTRGSEDTLGEASRGPTTGSSTPPPSGPSGRDGITGLPLKRGVINFLAIFLAVTLSFLAEDWREDLNEVEDGLRSLQGILADIDQDVPAARQLARVDSVAMARGLWLHRNWERTDLPVDSVDAALQALHSGAPYTPVRSEYESAKYAGRLQYLENAALRQQVTSLYESNQPLLVHVYDLRTDFTLELWRLLRPYESYATSFDGGGTVPPVHLESDWSELRTNTALRNALVESISLRRVFSNLLRGHVADSQQLRRSILEELDQSEEEA